MSSKKKVLLVDDRPIEIQWLIDYLVQDLDCEVVHLTTEKAAREHIQSWRGLPYDLGVIDIMIPVAKLRDLVTLDSSLIRESKDSGIRLCRLIRGELGISKGDLPLLAISARVDDEFLGELEDLNVVFFGRTDEDLKGHIRMLFSES